ncbi:MAG: glutamate--tRNA ligase [Candidatus Dadabacteria bacterium]|nr:MAG: glutamate--tRNA ligase [Candidatus Dadabacteria bacterium]
MADTIDSKNIVRTRFAPSPTGFLHVGGVRTNFYAWLLARRFGGKFVLRIEDTDRERFVPGAVQSILEDLQWLGIDIDEGPTAEELKRCDPTYTGSFNYGGPYGPYVQSQRIERYKEVAERLVEMGYAYRCDCTPEMLKKEREEQMARREPPGYSGYCRTRNVPADTKHVIRLKIPERESIYLDDAVKGRIVWDKISLRDTVLLKSDGFPTYHLAVVVDDHDMKISHVMRGEEWISTAPVHILLYRALGWKMPVFCHLPSVLGQDGKKLSKRHGATNISAFRREGYLPEALLNLLLLVGWNPGEGEEQEIFTREEMIRRFTIENINKAAAVFSYDKLKWMNGVYIRNMPQERFIKEAEAVCLDAGIQVDEHRLRDIAPYVQERIKLLTEVPDMVKFLFVEELERDYGTMFKKGLPPDMSLKVLRVSLEKLEGIEDFTVSRIEETLREVPQELDLKVGKAFVVIRIAVTGQKVTPPLFESIYALGRETAIKRLKEAIEEIESEHYRAKEG